MKVILFIRSSSEQLPEYRETLAGIQCYARRKRWTVQITEAPRPSHIPGLIRFWSPIGCIVEQGGRTNPYPGNLFGNTPVVYINAEPESTQGRYNCITSDSQLIADIAARELLSLNLSHFAYVPSLEPSHWSDKRQRAFTHNIGLNGYSVKVFSRPEGKGASNWHKCLSKWLSELEMPCGVFAANDPVGSVLMSTANRLGLSIPQDLAIVSADNNTTICENTIPTLSSVSVDFNSIGYLGAQTIDELSRDPNRKPCTRLVTSSTLVRRASTRSLLCTGDKIKAALGLIQTKACDGLSAKEAIAVTGLSRRAAEYQFRNATGKSILQAIHDVRLDKAEILLRASSLSVLDIALACGYARAAFLQKAFRKRTGQTMTAYRKSLQIARLQ